MSTRFRVRRLAYDRFHVYYQEYFSEIDGHDLKRLKSALKLLGLDRSDKRLQEELRHTFEVFLMREARSVEKFGKPRHFRVWRVDARTLQVDFQGCYAELDIGEVGDSQALKRCLRDAHANDLLLSDLKRDVKDFLKAERSAPLGDVLFYRSPDGLRVLVGDETIHPVKPETKAHLNELAQRIGTIDAARFLATYQLFKRREDRIQSAQTRMLAE